MELSSIGIRFRQSRKEDIFPLERERTLEVPCRYRVKKLDSESVDILTLSSTKWKAL